MTTEEIKRKLIGSWTLKMPIGNLYYRFDEKQMHRLAGGVPISSNYKLVSNGTTVHIVADDEAIEILGFDGNDMCWEKASTKYVLNRGTLY